jgi:single-strand DNA-binding protein
MFTQLTICGRLGREPEIKYSSSGEAYTRLSVACDGGKKDATTWVSVTVFGKSAEACAEHLHKGRTVLCSGTPTAYAFVDKEGKARGELQMVANVVKFVDGKKDDGQKPQTQKNEPADWGGFVSMSDDDCPF